MSKQNFDLYPDILSAEQLSVLLGVSLRTVYKILSDEGIQCMKVGRAYKIAKINVIKYLGVK